MSETPKLCSAAPVFQVPDVGATLRWYEENLGFKTFPFPPAPPHVFGIVERDGVEIMFQRRGAATAREGDWHVYLRVRGVLDWHRDLERLASGPPRRQPYGDTEFEVRDPDGHVLIFSELIR